MSLFFLVFLIGLASLANLASLVKLKDLAALVSLRGLSVLFKFMKRCVVLAAVLLIVLLPVHADAAKLGGVVRDAALGAAGGALVRTAAEPINDFINKATLNRGGKYEGHTKVVPIVSIGNGTHIGAAQVGGTSQNSVQRTQAVAQLEVSFNRIRIKVLIPIDSINPIKQFRRVQGVGVTAIIDARL